MSLPSSLPLTVILTPFTPVFATFAICCFTAIIDYLIFIKVTPVSPSPYFPERKLATGAVVKVLHKLEPKGVLGSVFYEVEYTDGEQTKKGYVSDGFLTEYIFDDKEPTEHPDPMHSDKNDIKTVLLILLIVILVLAAAAYLLFIGVPRRGKRNKDKDKQ